MNLHQVAAPAIGTVNPFITVQIMRSTGYTTNDDGSRVPTYDTFSGPAQVQDLTTGDLQRVEGLNLQTATKKIYINGNWAGVVRADAAGGDIFVFADANWLVTQVPEAWPDWTCVIVTMQSPRPGP